MHRLSRGAVQHRDGAGGVHRLCRWLVRQWYRRDVVQWDVQCWAVLARGVVAVQQVSRGAVQQRGRLVIVYSLCGRPVRQLIYWLELIDVQWTVWRRTVLARGVVSVQQVCSGAVQRLGTRFELYGVSRGAVQQHRWSVELQ